MFRLSKAARTVLAKDKPPKSRTAQTSFKTNGNGQLKASAASKQGLATLLNEGVRPKAQLSSPHHPEAAQVEKELRELIEGEVRFSAGDRALYATDASNYRQVPIGVIIPQSVKDIERTISVMRRNSIPVLSRGGGTSLCGQCCNVAVVMDMSKYYNRVLELNAEEQFAIVQPGLVLDTLRNEAEKHHLTFAPDPSTHNHCTLGGMIGNNSCGTHSVMGGHHRRQRH